MGGLKFPVKKPSVEVFKILRNIFVVIIVVVCSSENNVHSDICDLLTNLDGGWFQCS
jgi:hypothetical protein